MRVPSMTCCRHLPQVLQSPLSLGHFAIQCKSPSSSSVARRDYVFGAHPYTHTCIFDQRRKGARARPSVVRAALDPVSGTTLFASGLLLGAVALITWVRSPDEERSLGSFIARRGNAGQKAHTLVCLGDSLTRGNFSESWVSMLSSRLKNTNVLNAGTNMHCSWNARQKLEEVVGCRPSHVVLLIGTNDIKAEMSPFEGLPYIFVNRLPRASSVDTYKEDITAIRDRLLAASAQVALASPPVLGEALDSEANHLARAYAAVAKGVAEEGGQRCAYLPLFERTAELALSGTGQPYDGFRFFTWMWAMCFDIYVMKKGYSDVQRQRKLGVTVDLVHLGPSAANAMVEMVEEFLSRHKDSASANTASAEVSPCKDGRAARQE